MKTNRLLCMALVGLGLIVTSCQKDHVKLANHYAEQLCIYNDYYSQHLHCKDPGQADDLRQKMVAVQEKMNAINRKILDQYHGDETIMAEIQTIIQTYECPTD